jgi:hypothetical protein
MALRRIRRQLLESCGLYRTRRLPNCWPSPYTFRTEHSKRENPSIVRIGQSAPKPNQALPRRRRRICQSGGPQLRAEDCEAPLTAVQLLDRARAKERRATATGALVECSCSPPILAAVAVIHLSRVAQLLKVDRRYANGVSPHFGRINQVKICNLRIRQDYASPRASTMALNAQKHPSRFFRGIAQYANGRFGGGKLNHRMA